MWKTRPLNQFPQKNPNKNTVKNPLLFFTIQKPYFIKGYAFQSEKECKNRIKNIPKDVNITNVDD